MVTGDPGAVAVVGAGPTGLTLAAELALAGVRCEVLERRPGLRTDSRAICLHARSMEALDLRGQANRFAAVGLRCRSFPLGLKGAAIDFSRLDSDFPYILDVPQSTIEELLAARALELGAKIRWSAEVTGVEQDSREVRLRMAGGAVIRASYVVACDGIRSFVRQALGIPFPGFPNPGSVTLADLYLDGLPMTDAYGDLTDRGMLLVFPFRDGSCRVVLYDYAQADVPVSEPVSVDEVRDGLKRVAGQDFGPRDLYWSSRYRSESRQAPEYRRGRVLLAGDAAHTHSPAGAQGMNTGLQDAMNLGWKLGAVMTGWAPGRLLDSYHSERHPVGAAVLSLTGRQFRLNTARTPRMKAVRWLAHRAVAPLPPVQSWLAKTYSGVAVKYPPDGTPAHRLAGTRLPRGVVTLTDGSDMRLYDLFHDGRFVLLRQAADGDQTVGGQGGGVAPAGSDEVPVPAHVKTVTHKGCRPRRLPPAMLIRPDGYVAWASGKRDTAALAAASRDAVRRWCGST